MLAPKDEYYKAIYIAQPRNINCPGTDETFLLIPNKEYTIGIGYDYSLQATPHGNVKVWDEILVYIYDISSGKCLGRDYYCRTKEKAAEHWQLIEKLS